MSLVLGTSLPETTAGERALIDHLMLVQRDFKPRLRLPTLDDAALRRLTMPVLVILGGRDRLIDSCGTRRRIERGVPHATVRYLPKAGHLILGQTDTVLGFLRGGPAPPAG